MRCWTPKLTSYAALGAVEELSAADKLALRDFLTRSTLDLAEAEPPTFDHGAAALCAVETEEVLAEVWASRDIACRTPGDGWGHPHEYPITKARTKLAISPKVINQDMLLPPPGAQVHEIGSELDGSLKDFGARFAKLVQSLLKKRGIWPSSAITEIQYQDAFVTSPLIVRLFLDSCAAVARLSGAKTVLIRLETRAPRQDASRYSPHQAFHDWDDADIHVKTIRAYARTLGLNIIVSQGQVPHGRYLVINFENGSRARIILDQGFGAWRVARGARLSHSFDASVEIQAARACFD
jgi:DEAD/DEAH box helicase domain-containing protein